MPLRLRAKPKPTPKPKPQAGGIPTRQTPNAAAANTRQDPVPTNRKVKPDDTTGGPENRQSVSKSNDNPDTYTKRRKDAADKAEKSKSNTAAWAAIGIPLAAVSALVAAALTQFGSSDGAEIKFLKIEPEKNADSWVPSLIGDAFQTKNLEFTWKYTGNPKNPLAIASAVRITKNDTIDIHDLPEFPFNNSQVTVLKVKSDNVFVINPDSVNTSNVSIENKGTGAIHTSFENQLDSNIDAASNKVTDLGKKFLNNLFPHIGTIIFIIGVVILFVIFFSIFLKSKQAPTTNIAANKN
jgi:hypothetical protein